MHNKQKLNLKASLLSTALLLALTGCDGDDGATGANGPQGAQGPGGQDGTNGQDAPTRISTKLVARGVLNAESPEGAAEIVQYHQASGMIYAINSSGDTATVELLDLNGADPAALTADAEGVINNTNLTIATTLSLSENTPGDANSISISQSLNLLAVAMAADEVDKNGYIAFYDISGAAPSFVKNVEVGVLPDMVTFIPDGSKVVVANEGEPSGDYTTDPEGSISIINIADGVVSDTSVSLTFTSFNSQQAMLESQGMMFPNPSGRTINGQLINTTVAMDLEPEYVAVSNDSKTAFVSLQENNGLVIVDLDAMEISGITGLGFKDWSQLLLDASDKDGGVNFKQYNNLYGMYQPDTIASFEWNGATFVVTANEGDGREYFFDVADEAACSAAGGLDYDEDDGCLSYTDESRAEDLSLDANAFADINNDDNDLGRLKVSIERGDTDNDGDFEQLFTYGARSFSIWDAQGNLVFDSGDDMERITAAIYGPAFNNEEDENEGDTRSDAKGPEPEALAVGKVGDRTLAFIGLERMGGVMVYDVTNPFNVTFVDYFNNRGVIEGADITGDLAPEGMAFIPATDSAPAKLIVGHEISGSVSVWEITEQ
ncbi:choice-of-anchor I family protein [Thalassotalea euphylliae]|uniref:Collagen-like protein n=1 Tax=Thalassotalea euphylliae TaxID=1655234 RepID=A0A3E0UJ00_9GAMM|nr:choice-of-anchor I family protein [Thalassotalea euphylliae]REL36879.1 collagen-like protein [Thalassotalea euphylliae]